MNFLLDCVIVFGMISIIITPLLVICQICMNNKWFLKLYNKVMESDNNNN